MRLTMRGTSGLEYVTEVADELSDQAKILLGQIARKEPPPADDQGARVRVDWGIVKLVRRGNEILVEEPDYRRRPREFVPGINFTCAVLRAQQCVHDQLGVGAEQVNYDQFLLVYPQALDASRVAAIRQAGEREGDSGWRVFDASRIDWTVQPEARRIYEVAGERPALLAVISLPPGWAVQLEGDTLREAASPYGERIAVRMAIEV